MFGILILARLNSERLPNKHLKRLSKDMTVIDLTLHRLKHLMKDLSTPTKIIIATGNYEINHAFEPLTSKYGVEIYYGDDDNIPKRLLACAIHFELTHFVIFSGDNPLTSLSGIKEIHDRFQTQDMVNKYIKVVGLPLGMNVEALTLEILKKYRDEYEHLKRMENNYLKFLKEEDILEISLGSYSLWDESGEALRITLDYEVDLFFFITLINLLQIHSKEIWLDDLELIYFITKHQLFKINNFINHDYFQRYWATQTN